MGRTSHLKSVRPARRTGGRLVSLPALAVRSRQVQSKRPRTARVRTLVKSVSRPGVPAQRGGRAAPGSPGSAVRPEPGHRLAARGFAVSSPSAQAKEASPAQPAPQHLGQHSPRPVARQPSPPPPKINLETHQSEQPNGSRRAHCLAGSSKLSFRSGIRRRHHNPSNRCSRG